MDTLLSTMPKPDFVKIDVEGAEEFVLKGSHEILSQVRPPLYVEIGPTTREAVGKTEIFRVFSRGGTNLKRISIKRIFRAQ